MRPVFSSHVAAIGYDAESQALHVRYQTGRHAVFEGVPPDIAAQVAQAPSIGGALHSLIRKRFKHRYVEGSNE